METKDTLSLCSNSEEQQMQQIQDKAKKSCMVSFRQLHSHLKLLSNNDLKGTRTESGFKRAFATLFGQDIETLNSTQTKQKQGLRLIEKSLDASLVDTRKHYDEEPMAEVQTTAEINIFATGQQHTEQPEFNNEGEVDQNAEQCHNTCPLHATLTDNQTTELPNQSLESE
ncbi:hypothetical protein Tco_1163315 [Tanacetum coccineum]